MVYDYKSDITGIGYRILTSDVNMMLYMDMQGQGQGLDSQGPGQGLHLQLLTTSCS